MSTPRNTIDDATPEEWDASAKKAWYTKSAKIEGDSVVPAGTPSAQVTEAHRDLVLRVRVCDMHYGIEPAAQLIADSEAAAVAGQNAVIAEWLGRVNTVTAERDRLRKDLCEIANGCGVGVPDQEEAKRRIIAIASERDQLRAEVERLTRELSETIADSTTVKVRFERHRADEAERDMERLRQINILAVNLKLDAVLRAEKAEAELAKERGRLGHLAKLARIQSGNCDRESRSF